MIGMEGAGAQTVHVDGKARISIEPAPDWVDRTKVLNFERKGGSPITCLLRDCRIHAPERTIYQRNVTRLEGTQAVQQLSRVEIPFDPVTHSLVIHSISIFRNGVLKNHANLADIEVIRRERGLESGVVNGEISALLLLKDVRTGDVLDVEFSCLDEGSLFGEKLSWIQSVRSGYAIGLWKLVWIGSSESTLHFSEQPEEVDFSVSDNAGLKIRTWSARAVPDGEAESFLPPDIFAFPALQITPFDDWSQIVSPLFGKWDFTAKDRENLDEELAVIVSSAGDDMGRRIEQAIVTVRDAVRYQNYSPGILAVVPENVSTIWERRFGDCKEKSLLLVWILRELGVEADPVLVASVIGRALPSLLPSPNLFDHVVIRVKWDGKILWIDPTDTYRGGSPLSWESLPFHHGLPLVHGTNALVSIPQPPPSSLKVTETVKASRGSTMTRHAFDLTFRGRRADFMRGMLDGQGLAGTRRALKSFIETTRPGIGIDEDMSVNDDRDKNVIQFGLTGAREEGVKPHPTQALDQFVITPFVFVNMLPAVESARRIHPISVGNPDTVEQLVKVDHPDVALADYPLQSVDNGAFKAKADSYIDGGDPVFRFVLEIKKDRVQPGDIAAYRADMEKAFGIADVSIQVPASRSKPLRFSGKDPEEKWGSGTQTLSSGGPLRTESRSPSRRRRVQTSRMNPQRRGAGIPFWLIWTVIILVLKLILLMVFKS